MSHLIDIDKPVNKHTNVCFQVYLYKPEIITYVYNLFRRDGFAGYINWLCIVFGLFEFNHWFNVRLSVIHDLIQIIIICRSDNKYGDPFLFSLHLLGLRVYFAFHKEFNYEEEEDEEDQYEQQ